MQPVFLPAENKRQFVLKSSGISEHKQSLKLFKGNWTGVDECHQWADGSL
jgi:hypothetical protein